MKKIITTLLIIVSFAPFLPAQETNAKEDFSGDMVEVRTWNKTFFHLPFRSILSDKGLADARKEMEGFASQKTVLKPVIKTIPVSGASIGLRIFKPDTIRAIVLDLHGGGWSVGTAAVDDGFNDEIARKCKVAVVSVDYRLSPEHPFPGPIEDCKAAAKWLIRNAQAEFGVNKIIITGASAGAHLSAVITLYIRDSLNAIQQVVGVNLIYGAYDLGRTPSVRNATDTSFLSKKSLEEVFKLVFAGWTMDRLQNPEYSPLYADLKGLPPALFTVGSADPLVDDSYFMESRWRNAGNKTFLAVYPECPHGFNVFPTKIGRKANDLMLQWMNKLLAN